MGKLLLLTCDAGCTRQIGHLGEVISRCTKLGSCKVLFFVYAVYMSQETSDMMVAIKKTVDEMLSSKE